MECHHKKMRSKGGTDEYKNLVWLLKDVHKLIHCTNQDIINKLKLDTKGIERVNSLRKQVGNLAI